MTTEPVTPLPVENHIEDVIQALVNQSPNTINVQTLVDTIREQVVTPYVKCVNDCENKLRFILFDQFAIPLMRTSIERELVLVNHKPTCNQLYEIVRKSFKDSGIFPQ
jgi:hypothetical protein